MTEKEKCYRDELFKLMRENPELPVVPMVDSEIVADDGYARWMGAWGSASIGEYFVGEERIYFRDDSDPCEVEGLLYELYSCEEYGAMDDKQEAEVYADVPWIKAIIVDINLPD